MSILNNNLILNKNLILHRAGKPLKKEGRSKHQYLEFDKWDLYFRRSDGNKHAIPYYSILHFEIEGEPPAIIKSGVLKLKFDYVPIIGTELVMTYRPYNEENYYIVKDIIDEEIGEKNNGTFNNYLISNQAKYYTEGYTLYVDEIKKNDYVDGYYILEIKIASISKKIKNEGSFYFNEMLSYTTDVKDNGHTYWYKSILEKNNITIKNWLKMQYLHLQILALYFLESNDDFGGDDLFSNPEKRSGYFGYYLRTAVDEMILPYLGNTIDDNYTPGVGSHSTASGVFYIFNIDTRMKYIDDFEPIEINDKKAYSYWDEFLDKNTSQNRFGEIPNQLALGDGYNYNIDTGSMSVRSNAIYNINSRAFLEKIVDAIPYVASEFSTQVVNGEVKIPNIFPYSIIRPYGVKFLPLVEVIDQNFKKSLQEAGKTLLSIKENKSIYIQKAYSKINEWIDTWARVDSHSPIPEYDERFGNKNDYFFTPLDLIYESMNKNMDSITSGDNGSHPKRFGVPYKSYKYNSFAYNYSNFSNNIFTTYRDLNDKDRFLLDFVSFVDTIEDPGNQQSFVDYIELFCKSRGSENVYWQLNENSEIVIKKNNHIHECVIDQACSIKDNKLETNKIVNHLIVNYEFDIKYWNDLNEDMWDAYQRIVEARGEYTFADKEADQFIDDTVIEITRTSNADSSDAKAVNTKKNIIVQKVYDDKTSKRTFGQLEKTINISNRPSLHYDRIMKKLVRRLSSPYPKLKIQTQNENTLLNYGIVINNYPYYVEYKAPPTFVQCLETRSKNEAFLEVLDNVDDITLHCYGIGSIKMYIQVYLSQNLIDQYDTHGGYENWETDEGHKLLLPLQSENITALKTFSIRAEEVKTPHNLLLPSKNDKQTNTKILIIKDSTIDVLHMSYTINRNKIPGASFDIDSLVVQKKKMIFLPDGEGWRGEYDISMSKSKSIEEYFQYYTPKQNIDL